MPIFYPEQSIISERDIGGLSSRALLAVAMFICTLWAWEPFILQALAGT